MRTFTVTAERGITMPVWVLECEELGVVSQTKRLDKAADEVQEAICFQSGLLPDQFSITVEPVLPESIRPLHEHAELLHQQAEELNDKADQSRRVLIAALREEGYSMRDIGTLLGLSHQRVSVLSAETKKVA